jgi:KaiC/GvpD/RAD55 family RecA-like ATPase
LESLASTVFPALDKLVRYEGYPDRSASLAVGPPGIGKEALGYKFTYAGLLENDNRPLGSMHRNTVLHLYT